MGKRVKKPERGFTLIEILVVLTILSVLTTILILYSRTSESKLNLFVEQAKLVSTILRAKSLAIQTFRAQAPVCGYGVHFDPGPANRYLIFKEPKANGSCNSSALSYGEYKSDSGKELESEPPIDLKGTDVVLSGAQISDVFFQPPDPKVFLKPDPSPQTEVTIKLETSDKTSSASVIINKAGQVSIK